MPYNVTIGRFSTDRPNFHGYIIRFCADRVPHTRRTSFEALYFGNQGGYQTLNWYITQSTGVPGRHLEYRSDVHQRLGKLALNVLALCCSSTVHHIPDSIQYRPPYTKFEDQIRFIGSPLDLMRAHSLVHYQKWYEAGILRCGLERVPTRRYGPA
jgi:hypothetical protein